MILQTAALLLALGLVAYALGKVSERPGVAMIGAIIIIGVGASVMTGGLQAAAGTNTTSEVVTTQVAADDIGTGTHVQTVDASDQDGTPSGLAFDDEGERMYMSGEQTASIYKYNTSNWGLGVTTYQHSLDVSGEDSTPTGVAMEAGGDHLFVVGEANNTVFRYNATGYNISGAGVEQSLSVDTNTDNPQAVEFTDDGSTMYVIGEDVAEIHEYSLSDPFNLTTASHADFHDVSAQAPSPTGFAFGANGTRMIVSDASSNTYYQFSLGTAYNVGSASYTGYSLDSSDEVNTLNGVEYEDAGRTLLSPDGQNGNLVEYDVSQTAEMRETNERTVFRDVDVASNFPVGVVVIALGAVLLLGITGEASERELELEEDDDQ